MIFKNLLFSLVTFQHITAEIYKTLESKYQNKCKTQNQPTFCSTSSSGPRCPWTGNSPLWATGKDLRCPACWPPTECGPRPSGPRWPWTVPTWCRNMARVRTECGWWHFACLNCSLLLIKAVWKIVWFFKFMYIYFMILYTSLIFFGNWKINFVLTW